MQGYVAGEDGRAGIRGIVVDKAGAHMRNAMVGQQFSVNLFERLKNYLFSLFFEKSFSDERYCKEFYSQMI